VLIVSYALALAIGFQPGRRDHKGVRTFSASTFPDDTRTDLEISGEVLRMIAAAINADARWFWHGPDV
jgi:hypothetical protein